MLELTEQTFGTVAQSIKTKTNNTNKMKGCQTKSDYFILFSQIQKLTTSLLWK